MNRSDRRRAAREAGIDFAAQQRAERDTARLEAACLKLSPATARKILAEWAAKPGRSQAEVDAMNGKFDGPV